jgi:multidrug efflux pump
LRISQVCIDRPVLATVMSLVIALVGVISVTRLQNRELPAIDPPTISVTTVFPGAAPEVVETSVTDVLEDQLNGLSGVKHVTSISREQVSKIDVEFDLDRDLEAAANDVRDRVARIRNKLPEEIDEPVVAKRDSDANAVMWISLSGARYDQIQLTQIAESQIIDRLTKLPGVASVFIGGERRYSMRIWLDNHRLNAQNLTIAEVADALRRQNVDVPSGRLESRDTEFTVRSLGELKTAEGYQNLIVTNVGSSPVRLKDIARVEVGPEDIRKLVRFNGRPSIGLGVVKQSTANTLDVAEAVKVGVAELVREMPAGVVLEIAYDSSRFIRRSITDVSRTIFEAALLVVFVIYIFLRSFRATLIPAIAIPVSILGSLTGLYVLGFTINTLTLMGITLAIGLVVDDAIVVLENVTRWIEQGAAPVEAARRGMAEISFAVVAATLSAVAVFLPLTFLTDTTGRLFREFAVTVAAALAVSGFVAVTLSPALCALVLRPHAESGVKAALARMIAKLQSGYRKALRPVLARPSLFVGLGAAWLALGVFLYQQVDQELIPGSDRSAVFVFTQGPEGATIEYMDRYQRQAEEIVQALPEVDRALSVVALGIGTPGVVNKGILIAMLKDVDERDRSQDQIVDALRPKLEEIAGIDARVAGATMLSGFSTSPVSFAIQGEDLRELATLGDEIMRRLRASGEFANIVPNLYLNKPQLEVSIDRDRAGDLGISVRDIATTLQIMLGGLDISTFKLEGETYNVMAQLEQAGRNDPRDLLYLSVRGDDTLIPLASIIETRETIAPREIPHDERRRSVLISTSLKTGVAQAEAMNAAWAIAHDVLPDEGYRVAFKGDAEKFLESGNSLSFAYVLAVLAVFLVLAAQFESFVHPFTILVAVAFSFTGAIVALLLSDLLIQQTTLNLFSKIGLVMLIGLVTKNSILIVEFANQLRGRGLSVAEAVQQAAAARFRPILMTALATMVGILPIALGRGAGGDSRAPLGIAVVGGMFFSTALTIFIVPATYLIIERARERVGRRRAAAAAEPAVAEPAVAGGR